MTSPQAFWVEKNGIWKPSFGCIKNTLSPGIYEFVVQESMFGIDLLLKEMAPSTDVVNILTGSLVEYVKDLVKEFWRSSNVYKEMGLLHKRGILLEGAPGTGKTFLCILLANHVKEHGGVVIFTPGHTRIDVLSTILKNVRDTQATTPIVNIMEDIDQQQNYMDELLSMLDGETQIENILHLATTNFIETVDPRLMNRPSRFDEIINVNAPNRDTRRAYLVSILPENGRAQLDKMVAGSEGLTFAQLKELAISIYVFKRPVKETIGRLREMDENAEMYELLNENDDPDRPKRYSPKKNLAKATRRKREPTASSIVATRSSGFSGVTSG
jgi:SpoVK/Ycf46/Vps4 family AAA+-type ATPase